MQVNNPTFAVTNWKQIAANANQHPAYVKQRFAALRKEFLEHEASKGAASTPAAASPSKKATASPSKKRGHTNKAAEEDDSEPEATPAKKQRSSRPSNKGKAPACQG
ncbi:hypothetical protein PG994_009483 [Apiospora phragmitis]|uniref:HMG box domain-containing protein n=1 Tax=Apiospora phragmitis TaxID=2905665 RepID=A0ABR1UJE2_9PEZI